MGNCWANRYSSPAPAANSGGPSTQWKATLTQRRSFALSMRLWKVITVTYCMKEASKPNLTGVSEQCVFPSGEQFTWGTVLGAVLGWPGMLYTRSMVQRWVSVGELGRIHYTVHIWLSGPCGSTTQTASVNWAFQLCPSPNPDLDRKHSFLILRHHRNVQSWWESTWIIFWNFGSSWLGFPLCK